jgi:hypothetical protein
MGALYRQIGRGDDARAELAAAREVFGALGMPFWLGQSENERARADR